METIQASQFKNHFGAVMDRAGQRPIRIERRGRAPAILVSEAEFKKLQRKGLASRDAEAAMAGLRDLAATASGGKSGLALDDDPRALAILKKHAKHQDS